MRLSNLLILLVLFASCIQNRNVIVVSKTSDFVLIDTNLIGDKLLTLTEHYSNYPIYYIGAKVDTIKIGTRYQVGRNNFNKNYDVFASRKYTNEQLKLFVDTSISTTSSVEYHSENYERFDSTKSFKSFLLTLQNISDSSINLGRTFEIFYITRQVKDKDGKWISLDKKLCNEELCITGQPTIILQPNEVIISKAKRYSGSYYTDFRFEFGYDTNVIYSNTFKDFIDERLIRNFAVK